MRYYSVHKHIIFFYTENDTRMSTAVKVKFDYEIFFRVLKYFLPKKDSHNQLYQCFDE